MPFIPYGNVSDKSVLAIILVIVVFYVVMHIYTTLMDAYIRKKERELKESEEEGGLY